MHLLIVLLQQLLGMLPSAKKVLQPEVVRKGTPKPTGSEPDAYSGVARSGQSWMTTICQALSVFLESPASFRRHRPTGRGRLRAERRAEQRDLEGPKATRDATLSQCKATLAIFAERKATLGG